MPKPSRTEEVGPAVARPHLELQSPAIVPAQDGDLDAGPADATAGLEVLSLDTATPGTVKLQVAVAEQQTVRFTSQSVDVRLNGRSVEGVTVQPVKIDSLHATLIIDVSESMAGQPIEAAKTSAVAFVEALPPQAEITVIGFGSSARVEIAATPDHGDAIATIEELELRGETALYDAIELGLQSTASASRDAMVVLSDGGDTASSATEGDVISELGQSSVDFYAIALTTDESDGSALRSLSEAAGGELITTGDLAGLQSIYQSLASSLAEVYEIGFPVDQGGTYGLEIELLDSNTAGWERIVNLPGPQSSGQFAIEQPVAEPFTAPPPPVSASGGLLWAGTALVVIGILAAAAYVMARPAKERSRRRPRLRGSRSAQVQTLKEIRRDASSVVEVVVNRSLRDRIAGAADRAGLKWRVGEIVLGTVALALVLAIVMAVTVTPPAAPVGLVLGVVVPRFYLRFRYKQRAKRFSNQLPDILGALANVMRAGYSLNRAVDAVAREAEEPSRGEFTRALVESRIGGDFVASLRAMAERTGSVDLRWTADAVEINTTVGGDLTEVLDNVAETIRGRIRLKAQVDALTAEGRVSALILFVLPPAITTFIALVNPEYFSGIWDGFTAYALVGGVVLMMGIGGLWLRKMINAV
jgi:tight adherence protein B